MNNSSDTILVPLRGVGSIARDTQTSDSDVFDALASGYNSNSSMHHLCKVLSFLTNWLTTTGTLIFLILGSYLVIKWIASAATTIWKRLLSLAAFLETQTLKGLANVVTGGVGLGSLFKDDASDNDPLNVLPMLEAGLFGAAPPMIAAGIKSLVQTASIGGTNSKAVVAFSVDPDDTTPLTADDLVASASDEGDDTGDDSGMTTVTGAGIS